MVVVTAIFLAGCVASSDGTFSSTAGAPSNNGTTAGAFRSVGPAQIETGSYKVGPGDVLSVSVFQVEELQREVIVSDNGKVALPLIGAIQAEGRSAQEIELAVAQAYRQYLQSPQITVFVKEYNSQKFTVDGAVREPGVFPLRGQVTLLQAIATAKGLNQLADSSTVIVFRQLNGRKYAAQFNLDIIRKGQMQDPGIRKNDLVVVEESGGKRFFENMKPFLVPATTFVRLI